MKQFVFFSLLIFSLAQCSGRQSEKDLVILTVSNDRVELIKALSLIKSCKPKSVFINMDLGACNQDSIDNQLRKAFKGIDSLVVSSKVVPYGTGKYRDAGLFCPYFDSKSTKDGFINLITKDYVSNQVERVQIKNIFLNRSEDFGIPNKEVISHHMAVKIALALDAERTTKFLKKNIDTLKIDFGKRREFQTYDANQLAKEGTAKEALNGKAVIITGLPYDYLLVPRDGSKSGEFRKMSTSEIFANIACQILGK